MYKVGDEVLIKGEVIEVMNDVPYPVRVRLGSDNGGLVFANDEVCYANKIVKTYEMGLNDAWDLAKKIRVQQSDGGIPLNEIENIFGTVYIDKIFKNNTYAEALAKIEAYEKEKEIKPTDIVEYNGKNWVVTEVYKGEYLIWNGKKVIHTANVKKVGSAESIEPLAELLRQIGE